jgi:hypothetical protein
MGDAVGRAAVQREGGERGDRPAGRAAVADLVVGGPALPGRQYRAPVVGRRRRSGQGWSSRSRPRRKGPARHLRPGVPRRWPRPPGGGRSTGSSTMRISDGKAPAQAPHPVQRLRATMRVIGSALMRRPPSTGRVEGGCGKPPGATVAPASPKAAAAAMAASGRPMAAQDRRGDQRQRANEVGPRRVAGAARGDGQLREGRAQDTEPRGKTDGDGERGSGGTPPRRSRDHRDRSINASPRRALRPAQTWVHEPVPRYCRQRARGDRLPQARQDQRGGRAAHDLRRQKRQLQRHP